MDSSSGETPSYAVYRIGRGETSVFSSSPYLAPYKSAILPLWRFRTPAIARTSSAAIYERFIAYHDEDDFVGMDMCRKYLQMGMTRAKRYANYKGGQKYEKGSEAGKSTDNGTSKKRRQKSDGHPGKEEKEEASRVFREVWERSKTHPGYLEKKDAFLKAQKKWERDQKSKETLSSQ